MVGVTPTYGVLLIDDDPYEESFVRRALRLSTDITVNVISASNLGEAIVRLGESVFDLILLDNRLTQNMSAADTVPAINAMRMKTPLTIITADTSPQYLTCPEQLGVNYIVDKIDLVAFLKSRFAKANLGITCNQCEFEGRPECPKMRHRIANDITHSNMHEIAGRSVRGRG